MQRYVPAPCCSTSGHITNHKDADFIRNMATGLTNIRETMKDFIYMKRVTNFKVVSADKLLGWNPTDPDDGDRMAALWGNDPIHMTRAGYRTLADHLIILATSDTPFTNSRGKVQTDESRLRNTWVAANSASAKRRKIEQSSHQGYKKYPGGQYGNRRGGGYGRRF